MPTTLSKPLYAISVPMPKLAVAKATLATISNRPKLSTEQALKGYDYLKSRSYRNKSTT